MCGSPWPNQREKGYVIGLEQLYLVVPVMPGQSSSLIASGCIDTRRGAATPVDVEENRSNTEDYLTHDGTAITTILDEDVSSSSTKQRISVTYSESPPNEGKSETTRSDTNSDAVLVYPEASATEIPASPGVKMLSDCFFVILFGLFCVKWGYVIIPTILLCTVLFILIELLKDFYKK